jgi:hypothetical protein
MASLPLSVLAPRSSVRPLQPARDASARSDAFTLTVARDAWTIRVSPDSSRRQYDAAVHPAGLDGHPEKDRTAMRYMVVERYTHGPEPVYARAAEKGRMLPEGLAYVESWVDERTLDRCFQLMETEEPALFDQWIGAWSDLVQFEVVPVVSSGEAAARVAG